MKKGYVYFVKHNGMSPIKIGMSSGKNPNNRIDSINTYSPYRIQVVGIIETYHPLKLEKRIHKLLNEYRLNGEWFNISIEKCNEIINFFSDSKIKNDYSEMYYSEFLLTLDKNRRIMFDELRSLINNFNKKNNTEIKLRKFNKYAKKYYKNLKYANTNGSRWFFIE